MTNVNCSGSEESLAYCPHDASGINCDVGEAAGVTCDTANRTINLRGGSGPHEGNVFVGDRPVCDDLWDLHDAAVVCRELGHHGAVRSTRENFFGAVGRADFAMDDVKCNGTEKHLFKCPHNKREDCGMREGAGVVCDTRDKSVIDDELKKIE